MPAFDVAARYEMTIDAPAARVYATVLSTDISRPWLVRGLMGIRMLPKFIVAPRAMWTRMRGGSRRRASLSVMADSDFILLDAEPARGGAVPQDRVERCVGQELGGGEHLVLLELRAGR